MKSAILILMQAFSCGAFSLTWDAPVGYLPTYIVMHGTISGAYTDWSNAGETNFYAWTTPLPAGVNYFNVVAMADDDATGLQMSALAGEASVTNTPEIILTTITMTSTNVNGIWQPWSTNSVIFSPSLPQEFFKDSLFISKSNQIIIPAPK